MCVCERVSMPMEVENPISILKAYLSISIAYDMWPVPPFTRIEYL